MGKELLIKFLNNQCSEAELDEVLRWVKTDALGEEGESWGLESWNSWNESDNAGSDEIFMSIFDKIQEKIDINNKATIKVKESKTHRVFFSRLTQVAATLLIPVLIILIYTLSENKKIRSSQYVGLPTDSIEVIAPLGSRTIAQLSDGSVVHLNYGSKIKYSRLFGKKTREVRLSGEAFFEVSHDPAHPFVVKAKKLNIKALGTKFDVLAYPGNDWVGTTLIEGKVELGQSGRVREKTIRTLSPGQHVDYDVATGHIACTNGNTEKYTDWKDGILFFDDSNIQEVAEKIGRMYNVDIEVDDKIKDYTYTVKFIDESLPQILDLLTRATPVEYKMFPRERMPDGSYSRQRILFEKRFIQN